MEKEDILKFFVYIELGNLSKIGILLQRLKSPSQRFKSWITTRQNEEKTQCKCFGQRETKLQNLILYTAHSRNCQRNDKNDEVLQIANSSRIRADQTTNVELSGGSHYLSLDADINFY